MAGAISMEITGLGEIGENVRAARRLVRFQGGTSVRAKVHCKGEDSIRKNTRESKVDRVVDVRSTGRNGSFEGFMSWKWKQLSTVRGRFCERG